MSGRHGRRRKVEFWRLPYPKRMSQQALYSKLAEVRRGPSPEPVARLSQCSFQSAHRASPPSPRAGLSSLAASSRRRWLSNLHAASECRMCAELIPHTVSGLRRPSIEARDAQRRNAHVHEVSMERVQGPHVCRRQPPCYPMTEGLRGRVSVFGK